MTGPNTLRRTDRGQTSAEYLGLIVGVALIVGMLAPAGIGGQVSHGLHVVICRIMGGACSVDATASSHVPDSCVTLSHVRSANLGVTVASVAVEGGVTLTLSRQVDSDGTVTWTVEDSRNGGVGLTVQAPGAEVHAGGAGGGEQTEGSLMVVGSGGYVYTFDSEAEARDFLTTATHQVGKDLVVGSNPITNLPGIRDIAMLGLDQVDGRSYDPPEPTETYIDGGLQGKFETVDMVDGTGGQANGSLTGVVGYKENHQDNTHTVYLKASGELAGELGVLGVGPSGSTDGEVVIGVTYDAEGRPIRGSLVATGSLSGGFVGLGELTSPTASLGEVTQNLALRRQDGVAGAAEFTLDLTKGDNLDVFADTLHSANVPILLGDGSDGAPPLLPTNVARLYDLYDSGAEGTTLGVVTYDQDKTTLDIGANGGAGVKFGLGAGGGVTDRQVTGAYRFEPRQGMVRWVECSG